MTTPTPETPASGHVNAACDDDGCFCPDDVFWARLLGDDDPCAPGKDWAGAAFTEAPINTSGDER